MTGARITPLMIFTLTLALPACDPGSQSRIEAVGEAGCEVKLKSRSGSFALDMLLACSGPDHTKCDTITALQCGGAQVPMAAPIPIEGCPGARWCVDDCASVPAPGEIWDTPEILSVSSCNVYENKR